MLSAVGLGAARLPPKSPFLFTAGSGNPTDTTPKLAKLPKGTRLSKRPITHPAPPSLFTSADSPKVQYITTSTPFISAIKRINQFLRAIEARDSQSLSSKTGRKGRPLSAKEVESAIASATQTSSKKSEEVFLKASGIAIPRALSVALYFQNEGHDVRIETGSVHVIDDVLPPRRKKQRNQEVERRRLEREPNVTTQEISFPNEKIGAIIGKKGVVIAGIREQSGAVIEVKGGKPDELGVRVVSVTGTVEQRGKAVEMMEGLANIGSEAIKTDDMQEDAMAEGHSVEAGSKRKRDLLPESRVRTISAVTVAISLR